MRCHVVLTHWQRRVTLGFLILPAGLKAWSPVNSDFMWSCHHLLILPTWESPQILSQCRQYNWKTHQNTWHFISISYLVQAVTVLFTKSNHTLLKSTNLLLKSAGNVWQSQVLSQTPVLCTIHTHQPMLALKWCHVMCYLASSCTCI